MAMESMQFPQENYQQVNESVPVKPDEIYANMMQDERVKNTISQTSPDNQLADIEWRIRGYKKNYFTGQWEPMEGVKPINQVIVSRYISFLSSLLQDGTRFTNLSSNEINKIMKITIEWLTDDLNGNADKYGIHGDYSERTRIGLILLNHTFIVLKRAQNGMEGGRIWRSLNLTEDMNPMPQKKGFLDALKIWK